MKFIAFIAAIPAVLAVPSVRFADATPAKRQGSTAVTDELLFTVTLPAFTARRNAKNPADLDWESDGCSSSPDNPFGFPFLPACHRHDFGYRNYKKQSRFTDANRLKIDDNFKKDLYYQCSSSSVAGVCRALADVYYAAVRAFGGANASKRETQAELVQEYEAKLAIYNAMVAEAQKEGALPTLDY